MCIEPLSFENLLCQMLDLIHPLDSNFVTLVDLKRKIELVHIFFDTFFDLEKYLDHENKDSFAVAAQKVGSKAAKIASEAAGKPRTQLREFQKRLGGFQKLLGRFQKQLGGPQWQLRGS